MILLGTHVPVSSWTVVVAVTGLGLSGSTYRLTARRLGLRRRPTAAFMGLLSVVFALTVTPDGSRPALGLAPCIPLGWSDVPVDIAGSGGGVGGYTLNVLLFLPLSATLVIATRRLWPGLALAILPPAVELSQTLLPGRACSLTDVLTNLAGVTLGVVVGGVSDRCRRAPERSVVTDIAVRD